MIEPINLPLILGAALMATASPGPATLTIASTSMDQGRRLGLAVAAGVTTGSLVWSAAACLGLGALMAANPFAFEALRYLGAGYFLFLAYKSARRAFAPDAAEAVQTAATSSIRASLKGLALHLTNPKAIFFFASLYAIGISHETPPVSLAIVVAAVGLQSAIVFHGYALLFSEARIARGYARLRRWFAGAFALAFRAAGLKILTARLH